MVIYNLNKYKSVRNLPSQSRGKERVRTILTASLSLFKEQGVESVTTNEIAERAGIPIGSLYRYYPNKDAIIMVLTDLYVDDLSEIFDKLSKQPLYAVMAWDEICFQLVDSWVTYSRMSGSFAFLYAERANPRLRKLNQDASERFATNFNNAFTRRCPLMDSDHLMVVLQFAIAASELGINDTYKEYGGGLHREACQAIARYVESICDCHSHDKTTN